MGGMVRSALAAGALVVGAMTLASAGTAAPGEAAPLARAVGDADLQWGACPPIFPKGCEIAVLHGNPAQPNADIFLRVPGGYAIPPHTHKSAERMILVAGQLKVKYQGADEELLTPGNYAYGPAKLPHRGSCVGDQPCILFIAFEGPVDAEPSPAVE